MSYIAVTDRQSDTEENKAEIKWRDNIDPKDITLAKEPVLDMVASQLSFLPTVVNLSQTHTFANSYLRRLILLSLANSYLHI